MAFGGGVWTTQNKILPGAYINFISAARASSSLSDRGYAALALPLDWGVDGDVFAVDADVFQERAASLFGYAYGHEKLKGLRDLFRNARTAYLYRLNGGGAKAANTYATAKYSGLRGNDLKIVIETSQLATEEDMVYDVTTVFNNEKVERQTVKAAADLVDNEYVVFNRQATLELTAGTPLSGGTNGTAENGQHETFLRKIEGYSFNTIGCLAEDETTKAMYAAFADRMRNDVGVKFQCVMHRYAADSESVISVENNSTPELVYWTLGAQAGCAVNASVANKVYDGEYDVVTDYTQRQLELAVKEGKFILHRANRDVRVLMDINTFVSYTAMKGKDFSSNQSVRVLDQIGNDIALLFNEKYQGREPNDASGRVSLWSDIVKHHEELVRLRAMEGFNPEDIVVGEGDTKNAVVVVDPVTPINAMTHMYMAVYVS